MKIEDRLDDIEKRLGAVEYRSCDLVAFMGDVNGEKYMTYGLSREQARIISAMFDAAEADAVRRENAAHERGKSEAEADPKRMRSDSCDRCIRLIRQNGDYLDDAELKLINEIKSWNEKDG